jgi:hypothetical protein
VERFIQERTNDEIRARFLEIFREDRDGVFTRLVEEEQDIYRRRRICDKTNRRRARIRGNGVQPYKRGYIVNRDQRRCHLCWKICAHSEISLDHLHPISLGGADAPSNVAVACRDCNVRRGVQSLPPTSRYTAWAVEYDENGPLLVPRTRRRGHF